MSAFVVDNSTLNRILTHVATDDNERSFVRENAVDLDDLFSQMHRMNVRAVNQRYGENGRANPRYRFQRVADASLVRAYKSLECLLYQASEGNVPNTKLYKALQGLANRWAHRLAWSLADKEDGCWS